MSRRTSEQRLYALDAATGLSSGTWISMAAPSAAWPWPEARRSSATSGGSLYAIGGGERRSDR